VSVTSTGSGIKRPELNTASLIFLAAGVLVGCSDAPDEPARLPDSRPSEWAYQQRTFPHGRFNRDAYTEAYASVAELERAPKRGTAGVSWELAGPTNVGGRISDVEFDPVNPNIVYASAATGGVFKSTDTGRTWKAIFDGYAVVNVGDIGISKSDPSILYVGTGEANGGHNNLQGAGVFKSTDAGISWVNMGLEETAAIGRIVVDPTDPNRVFVAATGSYFDTGPNRGVYRSDDGGLNWERVLFVSDTTGAIDLVMNPFDPDILYAAMWHRWRHPTVAELTGRTSGIYRSKDGGDTWVELGPKNGLPNPDNVEVGRIGLAISESRPNTLFAAYTGRDRSRHVFTGLYKTSNGGDAWTNFDPNGKIASQFVSGFSWYFGQVRVSPTDPDRVYVMEVEFQHTRNGGKTWGVHIGGKNLHVDHHALAFHPNDSDYIISGNDGGLNISEDGGATWSKIRGLPITQFYEIEIDNRSPEQIYGGTQDNETVMTKTGDPDDWERLEMPIGLGAGGDGFYVKVTYEPAGHKAIYAESQFGSLFKSFAGDEFRKITPDIAAGERRNWSTPYAFPSDTTPAILYYGTHSLYKSETRGTTWRRISPKLASDWPTNSQFGTITSIDISDSSSETIVVGTDDGKVWFTDDDGLSWFDASDQLPERWVTRVTFDPLESKIAYATFSGLKWRDPLSHVFRTDDFGAAWTDISGNLPDAPVNAFSVDPVDPRVIYVGTDVGAFVHFDRGNPGTDWEIFGEGLPLVAVYDLKVNANPHFVVVGTHGRSMYKLDLSGLVTASDQDRPPDQPEVFTLEGNYPNPFSTSTTIIARLTSSADVKVEIFDLAGRRITTLHERQTAAGVLQVKWDGTFEHGLAVPSGVYLYRISSADGGLSETGKMSLLR
jgi:photosystem II stability/assembly factor-like uncharacterized protein